MWACQCLTTYVRKYLNMITCPASAPRTTHLPLLVRYGKKKTWLLKSAVTSKLKATNANKPIPHMHIIYATLKLVVAPDAELGVLFFKAQEARIILLMLLPTYMWTTLLS